MRARIHTLIARLVEAGVDDLLTLERPELADADRAKTIRATRAGARRDRRGAAGVMEETDRCG